MQLTNDSVVVWWGGGVLYLHVRPLYGHTRAVSVYVRVCKHKYDAA